MFDRVLIANRGEIARRVIRTCRRLDIGTVAVYSDADGDEPHVTEADHAVRLGPAPAAESYLDVARMVDAAVTTGCDAVHPGYGFLAENAAFARAVGGAGLTFIGPPPEVIALMGDKAAAKRAMAAAGVPVVPGHDADDLDDDALVAAAASVGTPLLVKAVAGGGGKGMRAVHDERELVEAISGARREARGAFGDDRLILERLVHRPRHIEVQVFADDHGEVVHLLERECSVQRRHQKVVEEAPSPVVDPGLRRAMGEAAVTAARTVDYRGAGTVEFLVDGASLERGAPEFFFLEMNTRLQVEHPVTEAVTGLDLVELQLAVAAGRSLDIIQDTVVADGHAIEVRLYAEDPVHQLPQTGRIAALHLPEGVRCDLGVGAGSRVSRHYDPMLGKLVVHAADRATACDDLVEALSELHVAGVITNAELLAAVVDHPAFRAGELTTSFLEEHLADFTPPPATASAIAAAGSALQAHHAPYPPSGDPTSPWARLGALRTSGAGGTPWYLTDAADADQRTRTVAVRSRQGRNIVRVDGLDTPPAPASHVDLTTADDGGTWAWVHAEGHTVALRWRSVPRYADATAPAGETAFTSPMPGAVLAVPVAPGEHVEAGSVLVLVEAMKMEHPVRTPTAGTVTEVLVAVGDAVESGTPLVAFEPDPAT